MRKFGILSDTDISREIHNHKRRQRRGGRPAPDGLSIEPFDPDNVQPASYDLTLGTEFERERGRPREQQSIESGPADRRTVETDAIEIQPGEFVLGHTAETISLPKNISGEVKGRSSLGRLGLIPHTAGWADPGFSGQLTLEFVNHSQNPVIIKSGQRVAQIVFSYTNSDASTPYGDKSDSKYQGQSGVTGSRIEEDRS